MYRHKSLQTSVKPIVSQDTNLKKTKVMCDKGVQEARYHTCCCHLLSAWVQTDITILALWFQAFSVFVDKLWWEHNDTLHDFSPHIHPLIEAAEINTLPCPSRPPLDFYSTESQFFRLHLFQYAETRTIFKTIRCVVNEFPLIYSVITASARYLSQCLFASALH